MRILVSACLLGYNCKYNGKNNYNSKIVELLKEHEVIPVCPEMLGGLSCPRIPCEKVGDKIMDKEGERLYKTVYQRSRNCSKYSERKTSGFCDFTKKIT